MLSLESSVGRTGRTHELEVVGRRVVLVVYVTERRRDDV